MARLLPWDCFSSLYQVVDTPENIERAEANAPNLDGSARCGGFTTFEVMALDESLGGDEPQIEREAGVCVCYDLWAQLDSTQVSALLSHSVATVKHVFYYSEDDESAGTHGETTMKRFLFVAPQRAFESTLNTALLAGLKFSEEVARWVAGELLDAAAELCLSLPPSAPPPSAASACAEAFCALYGIHPCFLNPTCVFVEFTPGSHPHQRVCAVRADPYTEFDTVLVVGAADVKSWSFFPYLELSMTHSLADRCGVPQQAELPYARYGDGNACSALQCCAGLLAWHMQCGYVTQLNAFHFTLDSLKGTAEWAALSDLGRSFLESALGAMSVDGGRTATPSTNSEAKNGNGANESTSASAKNTDPLLQLSNHPFVRAKRGGRREVGPSG